MTEKPSKNLIKLIKKLHQKKYRYQYGLFIVERLKTILPYLQTGWQAEYIFLTPGARLPVPVDCPIYYVDKETLKKISALKNPYDALAVFRMKKLPPFQARGFIPVLDNIQDPGNLGTIIRAADWFGIRQIVCSGNSVDVYNPKVSQAAMGAHAAVNVYYENLEKFLPSLSVPVFLTGMVGKNVFQTPLPRDAAVVFGNEGHGIRPSLFSIAEKVLSIPHHSGKLSESLNLSVSAGVIMAEWFRKNG